MNQPKNEKSKLIVIAIVAAVISLIVSSKLFDSPKDHNLTAPVVQTISPTLPDIKNDPAYSTFLNSNALDATQPVQVGNTQNKQPFSQ